MQKLKVLIADDEAPARNKMVRLLQEFDQVQIVNVSTNGLEAYDNILKLNPDVVFLDIEMPGQNGLELVRNLPPEYRPHIVFATAYNEHAITAFEINAVDYLLKPFNKERVQQTLDKIQRQPKPNDDAAATAPAVANGAPADVYDVADSVAESLHTPALNKIPVPTADRYKLIDYDDIVSIEVDDRVTTIYTHDKAYPINMTLEAFEKRLPPQQFIRISRAAIINIQTVKEIVLWFSNRYKVVLTNKREVVSSREKSKLLKHLLKL